MDSREIDSRPSFNKRGSQPSGRTNLFTIRENSLSHSLRKSNKRYKNPLEQAEIQFKKSIRDLDSKFTQSNTEHYLDNAKTIFTSFKSMHMYTLAAAYLIYYFHDLQSMDQLDIATFLEISSNYVTTIIQKSKGRSSHELLEKHQMDILRYLKAIVIGNESFNKN